MKQREATMEQPGSERQSPRIHSESAPMLRVEQLSVFAGARGAPRTLVNDVSFELSRGQSLGIVGESGSGKSLTARAITGLLPTGLHARGTVSLQGDQLMGADERRWRSVRGSQISLLLQDPFTMLNPLQTAGAHLAESLCVRRRGSVRRKARAEVARRLAEVRLEPEIADRYPFQLSGGMRQRVALAAALARDPALLIADEPTTALDVTTQDEILRLLKSIQQRRGMALVLITHDLRVAFSVCDRIHVMYAGSVVESAPAAELMTAPAHPYSLGLLLAEPPVTHYVDQLVAIPGRVPAADEVADRCAFADRCEHVLPSCVAAKPLLAASGSSRASACIRVHEIRPSFNRALTQAHQAAGKPPTAPQSNSPILTVEAVRKTYTTSTLLSRSSSTTALEGVSFDVFPGESVGLVGESGSGKTTIARTILGLTAPDSGTIAFSRSDSSIDERPGRTRREATHRLVQVVFQDPYASLNPALTVGKTLSEALQMRGDVADSRGEVSDLLNLVGLPPAYANRRPAALSGGERQRIAIARALAVRPRLLICDEPVAALDVSAQAQVLELLRDIRRTRDLSMLFITHDLSVVRQMADRVIVLYRGRIVETGPTASVLDSPQDSYTRRLLEAVPGGRGPSHHDHAESP